MSDWRERANKRRDERHTKMPETQQKPKAAKKDTKKWCGGKVGREHLLDVKSYKDAKGWRFGSTVFNDWWVQYCTVCGKELQSFHPPWGLKPGQPIPYPDWLIQSGKVEQKDK